MTKPLPLKVGDRVDFRLGGWGKYYRLGCKVLKIFTERKIEYDHLLAYDNGAFWAARYELRKLPDRKEGA